MSESHAVDFKSYLHRCIYIFIGVLCAISLMIFISYLPHYTWTVKVSLILGVACINAFAGLLALTLYAMQDFPTGTITH
jgi:hypothetical protein